MIQKTPNNLKVIKDYLENVSEDELIEEVIVPLYNSFGYSTLRVVTHGPGEHGKDIVFIKYSTVLYDTEVIAVQAKAEKVNASNVVDFSNQLIRALRTPINGISGGSSYYPNYIVFFNSKTISNDAHFEFPYLIDGKNNVKILSQNNVADLMMTNNIIPESIASQLVIVNNQNGSDINDTIRQTLYHNDTQEVEKLFKDVIQISKDQLSSESKQLIIEYIFKTWRLDKSFAGTVKPMRWLRDNIDLIQPEQYKNLIDVVIEYNSDLHSYAAWDDTVAVFNSLTKGQYKAIHEQYISSLLSGIKLYKDKNRLLPKFLEFTSIPSENSEEEKIVREKIERFFELSRLIGSESYDKIKQDELLKLHKWLNDVGLYGYKSVAQNEALE